MSGYGIYYGKNNSAFNLKNIYIGVDGTARKVKAIYAEINGVAKLIWQAVRKKVSKITSKKTLNTSLTGDTVIDTYFDSDNHFIMILNQYRKWTSDGEREIILYDVNLDNDGNMTSTYKSSIEYESSYSWSSACNKISRFDDNKIIFSSYSKNSSSYHLDINVYNSSTGDKICQNYCSVSDYIYSDMFVLSEGKIAMSLEYDGIYTRFYIHTFNGTNITTDSNRVYRKLPNGYQFYNTIIGAALLPNNRFVTVDMIRKDSDNNLYFMVSIFSYDNTYTFTLLDTKLIRNEENRYYSRTIFSQDGHLMFNGANGLIGLHIDDSNNCTTTNFISTPNYSFYSRIGTTNCMLMYSNYNTSLIIYYDVSANVLTSVNISEFPQNTYFACPYKENEILHFNSHNLDEYIFE